MTSPVGVAPVPDRLPAAAWAVGWSFLAGQVIHLLEAGLKDESAWPLSVVLGVVAVVFFSHGVLRARMVRFVIVVVLLCLAVLFLVGSVLVDTSVGGAVAALVAAAQLSCLVWLARTPWFAWQRTRPQGGPSIVPLLAIAVIVGVLAGMVESGQYGINATFELG